MREKLIETLRLHLRGNIAKHVANIEVLLDRPTGVAEHPDIIATIEQELTLLAEFHDKLEMTDKYLLETK